MGFIRKEIRLDGQSPIGCTSHDQDSEKISKAIIIFFNKNNSTSSLLKHVIIYIY